MAGEPPPGRGMRAAPTSTSSSTWMSPRARGCVRRNATSGIRRRAERLLAEVRHDLLGEGAYRAQDKLVRHRPELHDEDQLVDAGVDEARHRLPRGHRVADDGGQLRSVVVAVVHRLRQLVVREE